MCWCNQGRGRSGELVKGVMLYVTKHTRSCPLLQWAMASVADQFTDEQIDEIKEAFNLFDRSNDGNVLISQLVTLFKMLGVHTKEAEVKVINK